MRTLIYIPIIHTDPDLGSLSADVEEKATRLLGERWQEHKRIVRKYWQEILSYFENMEVKGFRIFQDGLPVGRTAAQAMVGKLAETGSPNYRLLRRLANQGVILEKTEDPALLRQEYCLTKELVAKKPLPWAIFAFLNYKLKKGRLVKLRDEFIARQINQKLGKGEVGVCFIGAYHQILPKLARDIKIVLYKDPDKVKEYYQVLSRGGKIGAINGLARYLTKPVKIPLRWFLPAGGLGGGEKNHE